MKVELTAKELETLKTAVNAASVHYMDLESKKIKALENAKTEKKRKDLEFDIYIAQCMHNDCTNLFCKLYDIQKESKQ